MAFLSREAVWSDVLWARTYKGPESGVRGRDGCPRSWVCPPRDHGTRALAVVAATVTDLQQQAGMLQGYPTARALRGGRCVKAAKGVRLDAARVVRDASVSGELVLTERQITGTLRLTGRGIAHGSLRVQLTAKDASHAAGTLDGGPVHLSFRIGA
jgi:hypothetical protein